MLMIVDGDVIISENAIQDMCKIMDWSTDDFFLNTEEYIGELDND
jgi:hypothetical protein